METRNKIERAILLGAIPGLMFCIVPLGDGAVDFRFSWQLASIWLAGLCFMAWLASWWWRLFFLLAMFQVIRYGPVLPAYMTLVLIGIFLAAAEKARRIKGVHVLNAICAAGLLLAAWVIFQRLGVLRTFSPLGTPTGPLNGNAAGVMLGVCLPAFCRGRIRPFEPLCWWHLTPVIVMGLALCRSATGIFTAAAGVLAVLLFSGISRRAMICGGMGLIMISTATLCLVDSPQGVMKNPRWRLWRHIAWTYRSEALGRGLGSFAQVFPYFIASDTALQSVRPGPKLPDGTQYLLADRLYVHGHNEYLQSGFEMGLQALFLILIYLGWFFVMAWRARRSLGEGGIVAGGMAALAVGCMGWHVFHVAPLALIGVAWLGLAQNVATGARIGPGAGLRRKSGKRSYEHETGLHRRN